MKQSSIILALGFVGLLVILVGGVWLYTLFTSSAGNGAGSGGGGGVFGTLFPFGRTGDSSQMEIEDEPQVENGPVPKLRKIADEPAAGATFAVGLTGVPSIRYAERRTGHIYETPVDALTRVRVSNTTIPAVHAAEWATASTSIFRFLSEGEIIENFSATITATTTDQELSGLFLKPYVRIARAAPGVLVGLLQTAGGSSVELVNADGTRPQVLYTSPISSWVPHASRSKYFLASQPSGGVPGSLYEISGGELTRRAGELPGLTALVGAEGQIALSSGSQNTVGLYSLTDGGVALLNRSTLVEKCGWINTTELLCGVPTALPGGLYPDDWLLGKIHTDDELWRMNIVDGTAVLVTNLKEESGAAIDVARVVVSPDERYALFVDRNDLSLWSVALTPQ